MIGKTSIGRSFKGCCSYNMTKVEQGKGEILMSQGVRDYERGAMVADFVRQAQMNPDLSRSVWHTAISFDVQDEARLVANPQLMQQVASEYVQGMGLDQSQYVVIRHRGHRPQPFSHHCQPGGQRRANRQRQPQLQPLRKVTAPDRAEIRVDPHAGAGPETED